MGRVSSTPPNPFSSKNSQSSSLRLALARRLCCVCSGLKVTAPPRTTGRLQRRQSIDGCCMPDISCQDMIGRAAKDYVLENLLGYDGRTHHFEKGYWLKFEFKRVPETSQRPHGLDYSLTLHAPDGTRLLGFDNAHPVPAKGSRFKKPPQQSDHWHRTETDPRTALRIPGRRETG